MPKRSAEDRIEYYNKKIRKLQRRKQHRRVIVYSSSSDSEEHSDNGATNVENHDETVAPETSEAMRPTDTTSPPDLEIPAPPVPELEPELLLALGEPCDDVPVYGMDIHEKLAQRWLPILKKGLEKETKETLLKEYAIPSNCKLLKAPSLNAEISAAVAETVRTRDKKMQSKQDQLGLGITAMNRAMNLLLTGNDKVQAVKLLSDSCRILSDLHFVETQVRTKLITPGLDKAFLSIIHDQDRDETLFGSALPEKIKASKAIAKQGLQIKKTHNPRPSTSSATSSGFRPRQQENWSGPPRFPSSNRGGHTATYRTTGAHPYHRAPPRPQPRSTQPASSTGTSKRAQNRL